jgi:integrase
MAFPPFLGNSSVHFSRTGGSYCRISQLPSCGALKRYAREAGIGKIHLHQTRHTFARLVARRSGSLSEPQDALGHRHASTTRIYVESIAVKTDKYSQHILEALELPDLEIDSSSDSGADLGTNNEAAGRL